VAEAQRIDLVVPFYNPPVGWEFTVDQRMRDLRQAYPNMAFQLILVDDGSVQNQQLELAFQKLKASDTLSQLIQLPRNQGKGAALRAGIAQSTAAKTLFTDVDFPYDIQSMGSMIDALDQGADVALGHRQDDYYASVPWFRKGLSEWFRFVLKRLLHFPITDTQCGLKGMNEKGRRVFLATQIDRFLVDMEFIKLAVKDDALTVRPVVVHLREGVQFSKMGFSVLLQEGVNFVKLLLR
jgi:glycosyltransferase involved in cell wall biosynthesis